ncbi:MAG: hypothetical protein ACI85O_001347 [Saprospiraceae bacterium]|jgi:hypothetical protein
MKKIIYVFTFLILSGFGCTDNFEVLNTDIRRPAVVPAEPLFSNAVVNLFDLMTDANINRNVFRLYSQYWSQTTYPSESNYDLSGRDIPGKVWDVLYRDVLRDLKEAGVLLDLEKTPITQEDITALDNKKAIVKILEAYTYTILVDLFGDVPYTEALGEDLTPRYDNAQMVYSSAINDLQAAIADLDTSYGSFTEEQDPVYEGSTEKWKKFGNSLLL